MYKTMMYAYTDWNDWNEQYGQYEGTINDYFIDAEWVDGQIKWFETIITETFIYNTDDTRKTTITSSRII